MLFVLLVPKIPPEVFDVLLPPKPEELLPKPPVLVVLVPKENPPALGCSGCVVLLPKPPNPEVLFDVFPKMLPAGCDVAVLVFPNKAVLAGFAPNKLLFELLLFPKAFDP